MKTYTLRELRQLLEQHEKIGDRSVAPRLPALCASINQHFPHLHARMEDWSYTPYRKHRRIITWTGKRRDGKRIAVYSRDNPAGSALMTHFPLEGSYRTNWSVVEWLVERAAKC